MDYQTVFRDEYLAPVDLVSFAYSLNLFQELVGEEECWCIKDANHPALKNFACWHPSRPQFKGRDARLLSLAIVNQFSTTEKPLIVRKHSCKTKYCVNPTHYFYGTKMDVSLERQRRQGVKLSLKAIEEIRSTRDLDTNYWTYQRLSWKFKVPTQAVARICRRQTYDF